QRRQHLLGGPLRSRPHDGQADCTRNRRAFGLPCVAGRHVPARIRGPMSRLREERGTSLMNDSSTRDAPASSSPLTGAGRMLALAARRDRIRLSVWLGVLTMLMLYTPFALKLAYPTAADRASRVELIKTPAGIMLAGPMFGRNETDLGVMVANELMLTVI